MGAELTMETMETDLVPTEAPPEQKWVPPPGRGFWAGTWKLFGAALAAGAAVFGTYQVVTLLAHEERVEESTFEAASVTSLRVDNAAGSVRVVAGETSTIMVRAEISDGLRSTGESQTVVDGVLVLRGTCPSFGSDFCRVTYEVEVPRDLPIVIDADDGRVEVTGSTADVAINADNGSVELSSLTGRIDASTDNGSLSGVGLRSDIVDADTDNGRVELEFVEAPTMVEASSNNGRVDVVVPDDGTAYRVSTDTDNGSENVEVPTNPTSDRILTLTTDNGSVTARTAP